ncbi:HPr family phosphocarrier protein [Bacillus sp. B15-48]|uniref:HPr family phosphocarrier protein n=1 Tax=Bacillus sp. B15-48 TaxID=1548601 RepID=UPI00193ED9FF|nr:HPr family phosphocarrier protein [Bacillus sp. B15-48]MBM4764100.1 HPr family phosphocarrier protein [Bacillus sp. B15-48]
MNEMISSTILVQKRFSFQKMLEIHQEIKSVNSSVYLLHKHKVIDASSLSKLVSFLLTVEPQTEIKLLIEGMNVEADALKFAQLFANEATITYQKYSPALKSSDSFLI